MRQTCLEVIAQIYNLKRQYLWQTEQGNPKRFHVEGQFTPLTTGHYRSINLFRSLASFWGNKYLFSTISEQNFFLAGLIQHESRLSFPLP